ncbi:MAG: hypothetical protein ACK424_11305, partial [Candidatus Thermochlorobacter sp.]
AEPLAPGQGGRHVWYNLPGGSARGPCAPGRPTPEGASQAIAQPVEAHIQPEIESQFELLKGVVTEVRSVRSTLGIAPSLIAETRLKATSEQEAKLLAEQAALIERLARITLTVGTDLKKPKGAASAVVNGQEIYIVLEGLIDLEKEKARLAKEIEKTLSYIRQIEAKLSNESFLARAPAAVVEAERQKLCEATLTLKKLQDSAHSLA